MIWVFLVLAILSEVSATLSLKLAADGRSRWYGAVGAGYILAFVFISMALNKGLGIGVAYGIWAATGVALTAIASKFLFKEPLTLMMVSGIVLIVGGVLLIELGAEH